MISAPDFTHISIRPLTLVLSAFLSRSSLMAWATAWPTHSFACTSARHLPALMTAATLSKSRPVTPTRGSGHSHVVTTPTLSPPAPGSGPLPRSTLVSLNQSDLSAGGAKLVLLLFGLEANHCLTTPALF